MLTKEQLIQASDNLIKLYEKIEDDLLINVTRRFDVKKDIKDIEKWQTEKLSQLGALKNENIKTIAKSLNITAKEIESALTETGYKTLETDEVIYERALGLGILSEAPIPIEASPMLKQILKGAISNTRTFMNMINTTALQSANEAFLNIINQTYLETSLGIYDYNTSMRKAVRQLADEGIKGASYISAKGKKTYAQMDVAVRRCIVTSCSQTAGNMQLQRAKDWGCNLVEVSSHVGARPSHAIWQGKVYMLEGSSPEYPNFYVTTQYGTVTGLKGANCSHDFYPFFEGISNRTYYPVDEKENKRIYEESQEQRRLEREIRKEKRKILTAREVGDNEFLKESQLRLKAKEKELNKFIADTTRTKRTNRQQVMDFGHSEAMKAVWAQKKAPLPKTIKVNDTKLQSTLVSEKIKGVIPKSSDITNVRIIAGMNTSTELRNAKKLVEMYGGNELQWQKKGGIIQSKYYKYDVHWVEYDGLQYETKLKGVKPLK